MTLRSKAVTALCSVAILAAGGWVFLRDGTSIPGKSPATPQASLHPKPKSAPLHPVVAKIVGEGITTPYLKLSYLIKEIPTNLAEHDVEALIAFIKQPQPAAFHLSEWGSLTNDIQEALSAQATPHESVARALINMFRDENRNQLMRDYALQHAGGFAIYLVHTAHTRGGKLPPFFGDLIAELKSAAADPSKPWSGTAFNLIGGILRAADYRSMTVPGISPEEMTALAIKAASDKQAPLNARLPALQFASSHQSPEALGLARTILTDPASSLMLVQSAAAVLAAHGSRDDLALLESLRSQNTPHTRVALDNAIREISKR